jgi:hypothetical protein
MNEKEYIEYLKTMILTLESSVENIIEKAGYPDIDDDQRSRFKFTQPDSRYFQLCKLIRIVSSLHASSSLIVQGHFQDVGNIFRTIEECLLEINFIQESHDPNKKTDKHQEMIDRYFSKDLPNQEGLETSPPADKRVPMKKLRASMGRVLSEIENPEKVQNMYKWIYNAWSGYTHAEYMNTMELFELVDGKTRCRMNGMADTPKISTFRYYLASFIMKSFMQASIVAINFNLNELAKKMLQERSEIENHLAYKTTPQLVAS